MRHLHPEWVCGCISNDSTGRVVGHSSGFLASTISGGGYAIRPLYFRTAPRAEVRTSNSPNPTEPTGFVSEKACVWPAVPLAILSLPPILRLAGAGFSAHGNIHDRPAKPAISRLRGNSGAARPRAPRIGRSHSPRSASLVSRVTRSSFYRGRFSSRTLPRRLGKMASCSSRPSRIIDSAIAVTCVRFQTCCDQR